MSLTYILSACSIAAISEGLKHGPYWHSLDERRTPPWYDQAKVGILVHWGVYSVPSFVSERFWRLWQGHEMKGYYQVKHFVKRYPAHWTYADFAPDFKAELFDPHEWARLFHESGAKYVVLTAKHDEGFALWPSSRSVNWNAADVGPRRDLVGDLAGAVRNAQLRFGVSYTLPEWYNDLWEKDKASSFTQTTYSACKVQPELYDLVARYRPDVLRVDGEAAPDTYWNSTNFLAWLYSHSPVQDEVVVNDGWGSGITCNHGDFYTCAEKSSSDKVHSHKFESILPLDGQSMGYRRNMDLASVLDIKTLLVKIVTTIACNGNVLINIGARKDGTFPTIFKERLMQMGQWLNSNSEAVYGTRPWITPRDAKNRDVWFTKRDSVIYAFLTEWPGDLLEISSINASVIGQISQIDILCPQFFDLKFVFNADGLSVILPRESAPSPFTYIWVLRIV
ncbi:alpha-L-fucosidase [Galendromus occidentalis]|uniref:Putative alpha-L-fucosidase n=1 Tax=Galendromus occidentalis TaxID=34638 RepID=A0AAJ7L363_9ACAR|nr:alpha-L-fucosidase [Galendromus occidentalis]